MYSSTTIEAQVEHKVPEHIIIANAIKQVESEGFYEAQGQSGEYGAYQILPSTWEMLSKRHLGHVAEMNPINQDTVVRAEIEYLLEQGYTAYEIALIWNTGGVKEIRGVNKYGVRYDSVAYANKILENL